MTDKAIKAQAQKVMQQIYRHGTVSVFIDDEKKAHVIPGYSPELLAVYSAGIGQADIEQDLIFTNEERL